MVARKNVMIDYVQKGQQRLKDNDASSSSSSSSSWKRQRFGSSGRCRGLSRRVSTSTTSTPSSSSTTSSNADLHYNSNPTTTS